MRDSDSKDELKSNQENTQCEPLTSNAHIYMHIHLHTHMGTHTHANAHTHNIKLSKNKRTIEYVYIIYREEQKYM